MAKRVTWRSIDSWYQGTKFASWLFVISANWGSYLRPAVHPLRPIVSGFCRDTHEGGLGGPTLRFEWSRATRDANVRGGAAYSRLRSIQPKRAHVRGNSAGTTYRRQRSE